MEKNLLINNTKNTFVGYENTNSMITFGHNRLPWFQISLFIFDRNTKLVLMSMTNIINMPKCTKKTVQFDYTNWLQYQSSFQSLTTCWFMRISNNSLVYMIPASTKTLRSQVFLLLFNPFNYRWLWCMLCNNHLSIFNC